MMPWERAEVVRKSDKAEIDENDKKLQDADEECESMRKDRDNCFNFKKQYYHSDR